MTTKRYIPNDYRLDEKNEGWPEYWNWPHVSDLTVAIAWTDQLLGVGGNGDDMDELLEQLGGMVSIAKLNGVNVNDAKSILDLRRLLITAYNKHVVEHETDPDAWDERQRQIIDKARQEHNDS